MKKTLFMLALALPFFTISANAQLEKGNILVGSDLANFNLGLEKGSAFTMDITPKFGFFIRDNVALGGMVDLGLTSYTGATEFRYGVGALGRYYISDPKVNVLRHGRFLIEANVGISGVNVSNGGASTNGLGLGFGPGYAYFLTPNIGLETLLKYNGVIGFGNETTQSALNLNVGFQIYLPNKKVKAIANEVK